MSSGGEIRLGLTLHYDGSGFFGWQLQKQERTVQGELEAAVERLTGGRRAVVGAGRTDRGVHATGQVAAVDVPDRWTPTEFRRALNAVLPRDVWVAEIRAVSPDFHPRYDAIARTYEYRIGSAECAWSPFRRRWCWPLRARLETHLLEEAAQLLVGERSFAAFAKAGQPERGDRCTVYAAGWTPWEDAGVTFTVTANRYLHHMVRYLVGTMVEVATGRRPPAEFTQLLDRSAPGLETSPPAPAQGLFLVRVDYPEREGTPTVHTHPHTDEPAERERHA